MTRKLLSSVLAFTMIFGATMPMAIAEEAAPVESVEQYANYLPTLSASTLKIKAGATATVKIEGIKEGTTVTPTESIDGLTVTYDAATQMITVKTDSAFIAGGDISIALLSSNDVYVPATLTLAVALDNTAAVTDAVLFDAAAAADNTNFPVIVGKTSSFVVYAGATGNTAKPASVTYNITTGGNEFVSVATEDYKVSGNVVGTKVTVTGLKATTLAPTAVKVRLNVKALETSVVRSYELTINAKNSEEISALTLKSSASAADTGADVTFVAQAYKTDDYGANTPINGEQNLVWTINGEKLTFTAGVATITDIAGNTTTLTKGANDGIMTFTTTKAGAYRISVSDENGNFSASKTITVTDATKVATTDKLYLTDGKGIKEANKKTAKSDVLPGGTIDLGKLPYAVYAAATGDGKAIAANLGATFTYAIADTNAKKVSSVDANGVVTITNGDDMNTLLAMDAYKNGYPITVTVTAKFPADKSTSGAVTSLTLDYLVNVTKAGAVAQTLTVTDGKDMTVTSIKNGAQGTANKILTVGTNETFSAKVVDDKGFADAISQRMIWSIENNFSNDTNVYATINSATGVITPLKASAGKATAVGVSVADPNLMVAITLYITEDPNATPIPTAEPTLAPTAEPTAVPTAEPTTAPTEKPVTTLDGVVTASSLNVRDLPDGTKIGSLKKGAAVKVTAITDDGKWYEIEYNGGKAYVSSAYVEIKADEGDTVYAEVTTSGGSLNMRASASGSATVVAKLANGTKVKVLAMGASWTKVEYNGKTGYCATQYLTMVEDSVG